MTGTRTGTRTASLRRAASPVLAASLATVLAVFLTVPATGCRGSACCAIAGAALGAGADMTERRVRVLAVTCAQGNTGLRNVTRNVLATLRTAGRADVPVFGGAAQSLLVTPPTDHHFGEDGLGDFLPANDSYSSVQVEHAAVALVRLARRYPGRISLVCLGPMTNVALASRLDPEFLDNLRDVFVLGGSSMGVGNTKAATEFNVYMDAEAFEAVLRSVPKPVFLLPWETVTATNFSQEWRRDRLGALATPQMEFLNLAERRTRSGKRYNPADAMLALFVLRPDLITERTTTNVQVVLGDGFARAATLVDYVGRSGKAANAVLLQRADRALAECLLLELLSAPVSVSSRADKAHKAVAGED
ncbi:uncharacterized protein C1683.06c-like isoform X2 [Thrips palmi]|uniref:Uncharacterized protein C1683.06c-like isoform X2 n=1 Tax=Thrips palmi TaxID=161013 RepID=A0A6P8ZW20_THRPL|nr:uncharacterized protein C1683.06c-like isoform X2 [Thrips palmi]